MALARIRTHFPEEVSELCEELIRAGYVVETIRPDEFRVTPADLELTVDKLPVVEAWRHVPDAELVYVAPETPESHDIRSALGVKASREPRMAKLLVEIGERYDDCCRWTATQYREVRARVLEMRQRWTPPREYHAPVHLEPSTPPGAEHHDIRIDAAIEKALRQQEEARRREEESRRALEEQARIAEQSRRRAREAAEARALLEEQLKIEAMVRATESLRERVVKVNAPKPRLVERKVPRRMLRTRRERAMFRAGVAAFVLAFFLSFLASEALHPRPASGAIPQSSASSSIVPFPKTTTRTQSEASTSEPLIPTEKIPSAVPALATTPALVLPPEATTASLKPPSGRSSASRLPNSDNIADDEVIVRKFNVEKPHSQKQQRSIAHYSDLN